MPRLIVLFCVSFCFGYSFVYGQAADSLSLDRELEPVEVIVYFNRQPILGLTAPVQTVSARNIETQQTGTLLPALNAVAGVRMEERSPGSYRLAMRGSMIRSPFGIRNVKIYVDEFLLTDGRGCEAGCGGDLFLPLNQKDTRRHKVF